MSGVDEITPEADETTFTLDCTEVSPYTEPERYEAARVEAAREFEKLMRMLESRPKPTE